MKATKKSIRKQLKKIYFKDTQNTIIESYIDYRDHKNLITSNIFNINDVLSDNDFITELAKNAFEFVGDRLC